MSHTLSAPLLSRLSSLSAELSELCGLCDLLADPMPRNFVFASLRTLSNIAEEAAEVLGQLAKGEENPRRRLLPSLLDGYARNLAFVPPVMEAISEKVMPSFSGVRVTVSPPRPVMVNV